MASGRNNTAAGPTSAPVIQTPYMKVMARQQQAAALAAAKAARIQTILQEKTQAQNQLRRLPAPECKSNAEAKFKPVKAENFTERHCEKLQQPKEPVALGKIQAMPLDQRKALLLGEKWNVYIGDDVVWEKIPKNLLMTVSTKAQEAYAKGDKGISLPKDSIDRHTVSFLLHFLVETCHRTIPFKLPLRPTVTLNLALVKAGILLGMELITAPIQQSLIEYIKAEIPQYDEISIIERDLENDAIFRRLVDKLVYWRYKGMIPDPDKFEAFLAQHKTLSDAMDKHSEELNFRSNLRQERAMERKELIAQYKAARAEAKEARKEHQDKDTEVLNTVRNKLNGKLGGGFKIQTVTAEEARLLRRR